MSGSYGNGGNCGQRRGPFQGGIWDGPNPFRSSASRNDGGGGQRPGPFQGGIWDGPNPFRGGEGYRPAQPIPQRGDYDDGYEDQYEYDDEYGAQSPMMGGMRGNGPMFGAPSMGMGGSQDMNGPLGQSFSYSSYQDDDGNIVKEGYGPDGPFRNTERGGGMGGYMPTPMGQGGPPRGMPMSGDMIAGGPRPGPSRSNFDPYAINGRGAGGRPQGQHDPRFAMELEPADMPPAPTPDQEDAQTAADFMATYTQPLAEGGANTPPNAECPICLEPPSAEHPCIQIKDLSPCNHMIGRDCLKEMLMHRPGDRKECPLCRELFLKEDGIWQDSAEFDQLAQGINGGGRQHPAPGGFGGDPAGPCPGPPVGPPRVAPQVPRVTSQTSRNANSGGMANVRVMGDVNPRNSPQQGGMDPGDFDDDPAPDMGPPNNFGGSGQRLGGGPPRPPMAGMYGSGRPMGPFGGGIGYGDPRGGGRRGPFQGGFFDGPNPFR
jgi:hypothetical protein